ncbi:MAG: hypothetical protein Q9162_004507 [Coniocarpon cinnabarinum]
MPLNLLGKKSWNPYLDKNVLRVKADEDAFADRAETLVKLKDEHESNVQYAQLSRREAPPLPEKIRKLEQLQQDALNGRLRPDYEGTASREHYRKRRKLHGEDDTDRDIRVANDTDGGVDPRASPGYRSSDASLKGQDGHLQLFVGAAQQARLPDARQANPSRNEPSDMPWYAGGNYSKNKEDTGLNVLGKEDPGLQRRAQSRTTSMDPLSMMKSAQGKIKGSERACVATASKRRQALHGSHQPRERRHCSRDTHHHRERCSASATHIDDERRTGNFATHSEKQDLHEAGRQVYDASSSRREDANVSAHSRRKHRRQERSQRHPT